MKIYNITISTIHSTQPTKKLSKFASLALRQRRLYGKPRRHNTGKESDPETGLYYFGARYLDPKTSRWLSGDPAVGEYIPQAGRQSDGLPGMGGVFNYINLHVYHYAGNNPVKLVDPNGRNPVNYDERIRGIEAADRESNQQRYQHMQRYASINMTDREINMLYAAVCAESSASGNIEGEIAGIASTILNRVLEGYNGQDSVMDVITAPGQINGIRRDMYGYAMSELMGESYSPIGNEANVPSLAAFSNYERQLTREKLDGLVIPTVDRVLNGTIEYFPFQRLGNWAGPIHFGSLSDYNTASGIFAEARNGRRGRVYFEAGSVFFR